MSYVYDYSNPSYKRARQKYLGSPKGKFSIYKSNSLIRGFAFELSFKEFHDLIAKSCFYCGDDGFGIDRIDSTRGYIQDNCVSCCSICNRMKFDLNAKDFTDKCIKIANHMNI